MAAVTHWSRRQSSRALEAVSLGEMVRRHPSIFVRNIIHTRCITPSWPLYRSRTTCSASSCSSMSTQPFNTAIQAHLHHLKTHRFSLPPSCSEEIHLYFHNLGLDVASIVEPIDSFLRVVEATRSCSALSEIPIIWGCIKYILGVVHDRPSLSTRSTSLEHISRRLRLYHNYPLHALQSMDLRIAEVYCNLLGLLCKIQKPFRHRGKIAVLFKRATSRYWAASELQKAVDDLDSAQDRLEAELHRQYDSSSETDNEWVRSEVEKIQKVGTWPRREERRKTFLTTGFMVMPASGSIVY
ncbi:hypothetical protein IW261DRAFT_1469659 [Armillaria novae-zelandiae]|uniref:Uncharacterized protein n=1 Tax=Armillaria novae-zelandiae TaxID=153914 RepID=A0AA39PF78_9AGAR|nr:hypothetical protein IW261DRAFT_1469659 [Armillaria novae-zelandiae]